MTTFRARVAAVLAALALGVAAFATWVIAVNRDDAVPGPAWHDTAPTSAQIERGAYLARAGNCAACHTARGGLPYAGGRAIATPFGTVYGSNLTPDPATGLGRWSADDFWRALHHGRSRDGRLLAPVFPYPNFTRIARDDADALFAWLRTLPPVAQENRPHALRFPYDTQAALAVWRALYFRPAAPAPTAPQGATHERGAYLVRGLGHCDACHGERNLLGATRGAFELGGGLIPMRQWYAPSLVDAAEAGVAHWPEADIVTLLKTGRTRDATVLGPMAEVVWRSTQYLDDDDLHAIAMFLKALPPAPSHTVGFEPVAPARLAAGARLYEDHCAACHGAHGEGAGGLYPALAGNRAVAMDPPVNLVRVIVHGGFAPATAGNPRPFGMPPFAQTLDDAQIADLATFLRRSWGASAAAVSALDVARARATALD